MPDSQANYYSASITPRQYPDVVRQYPGVKDTLFSWQAVRSPAIIITYPDSPVSQHIKMYLTISFDILSDTRPTKDYCLAQYDSQKKQIVCNTTSGYPHTYDAATSSLTFSLDSPGAYAVIYCPQSPPSLANRECLFLCQNYVSLVQYTILTILLLTLVVWCLYKLLTQLKKLQQSKSREKRY